MNEHPAMNLKNPVEFTMTGYHTDSLKSFDEKIGLDHRPENRMVNEGDLGWSVDQRAAVRALENRLPLTGLRDFDWGQNGSQGQKIDAVYTWVNGEDPQWQAEFSEYQNGSNAKASTHPCRFKDHGEIVFSLLSLEKFAPWINQIFIIKKNYQCPDLSLLSAETQQKVIWVDEVTIKPPELASESFVPTFNSLALEANLHRILQLSERFIYFNNDMFLGNAVKPSYFFNENRVNIFINRHTPIETFFKLLTESIKKWVITGHRRHVFNAYELFCQTIGSPKSKGLWFYHTPVHQCCPLLKSSYEWMWSQHGLREKLLATSAGKFRSDDHLHAVFLANITSLWRGKAQLVAKDHVFVELQKRKYLQQLIDILLTRPIQYCVNDSPRSRASSGIIFKKFLQEYYGIKVQGTNADA